MTCLNRCVLHRYRGIFSCRYNVNYILCNLVLRCLHRLCNIFFSKNIFTFYSYVDVMCWNVIPSEIYRFSYYFCPAVVQIGEFGEGKGLKVRKKKDWLGKSSIIRHNGIRTCNNEWNVYSCNFFKLSLQACTRLIVVNTIINIWWLTADSQTKRILKNKFCAVEPKILKDTSLVCFRGIKIKFMISIVRTRRLS